MGANGRLMGGRGGRCELRRLPQKSAILCHIQRSGARNLTISEKEGSSSSTTPEDNGSSPSTSEQKQQAQQQQAQQAQQTQEQQTQEQQQTQALQAAQQQQGLMSAAFALPTPSGSGSLLSSGEQAAERQGPPNPVAMVTLPEKAIALPEMATALEKRLAMVRDVLSKFHSVGTAGMPDSMALLARESDRPEVSDD